jgi:AraC-like DNA-binding protein
MRCIFIYLDCIIYLEEGATVSMLNTSIIRPKMLYPKRSKKTLRKLASERDAWLAQIPSWGLFHRIFDEIPGYYFFAKDGKGRTMVTSQSVLERYQMENEEEMLGFTDYDINPRSMAEGYAQDDERLLKGEADRIEHMELWFDKQGMPDWYIVTKLPILNRKRRPIGVMGVLRRAAEQERKLPVLESVAKAVMIIRKEFPSNISMLDLADACGQSLRSLQRRFNEAFGISPQEFLIKTRVSEAMKLLQETSLTAAQIASRCGFVDASSLSDHFKKRSGLTPTEYRSNHHI